jgi:hypothetical protein
LKTTIRPLAELLVSLTVSTALFIVIALLATGLGYISRLVLDSNGSTFLQHTISYLEYIMLALDVAVFVLSMIRIGYRFVRQLSNMWEIQE